MNYDNFRKAASLFAVTTFLFLVGCATQRSLYHWGHYPDANYAWLKDEPQDEGEVFNAMVEDMEKAIAKDYALPPGFYAHFGLLYMQQGQLDKAAEYFEMEKVAFPEAEVFMDFLLKSMQGNRLNTTGGIRETTSQIDAEEVAK